MGLSGEKKIRAWVVEFREVVFLRELTRQDCGPTKTNLTISMVGTPPLPHHHVSHVHSPFLLSRSEQDKDERLLFLLHICCAMVLRLKGELMGGDFADNLQRLQSYPRDFDVEELVCIACA